MPNQQKYTDGFPESHCDMAAKADAGKAPPPGEPPAAVAAPEPEPEKDPQTAVAPEEPSAQ